MPSTCYFLSITIQTRDKVSGLFLLNMADKIFAIAKIFYIIVYKWALASFPGLPRDLRAV